jgi:hypothetical protein
MSILTSIHEVFSSKISSESVSDNNSNGSGSNVIVQVVHEIWRSEVKMSDFKYTNLVHILFSFWDYENVCPDNKLWCKNQMTGTLIRNPENQESLITQAILGQFTLLLERQMRTHVNGIVFLLRKISLNIRGENRTFVHFFRSIF